jgi:S1-C subfamily serine protease
MRKKIYVRLYVVAYFIAHASYASAQVNAMDKILLDDTKPMGDQIVCEVSGCKVIEMSRDSLFRLMGLKEGDVIKKWNGKKLDKGKDLQFIFNTINEQQKLTAVVDRNGKEMIFHYPKK